MPRNITDSVDTSLPARKVVRVLPTLARKSSSSGTENPQHYLQSIASERGSTSKCYFYKQVKHFFDNMSKDLEAWNLEVLAAVRNGDMDQLRLFHQQGRNLKCSNRFGETLMHIACRKALVSVVAFFIHEVGMPVNIHDDTGRSPLHDAFWTPEPNEELIDLILSQCPDLLFIQDNRGHCPLQYSRQSHWETWNTYLQLRKEQLVFTLNIPTQ